MHGGREGEKERKKERKKGGRGLFALAAVRLRSGQVRAEQSRAEKKPTADQRVSE